MSGNSAPAPRAAAADPVVGGGATQPDRLAPVAWPTVFLVGVDGAANVFDYAFHIFLGRSLSPPDFAIVQTLSAVLLIVLTAAGVWQPVVARFAAADGGQHAYPLATLVQAYLRMALAAGAILAVLAWLSHAMVASWLNVPPATITVTAAVLLVAFARPVVGGALQGQQRFVAFGLTRMAFAAGRLLLALILVGAWGGGLLAALGTLPLGAGLSLALGLAFLGSAVWRHAPPLPAATRRLGWQLSAGALLAYTSYMALINLDLVWVNRLFPGDVAAGYATAVLLRRALTLLPGAVIVVVYPRVAALAARGALPDGILIKAFLAIALPSLAISALYFALPEPIIELSFGPAYLSAAPLLGWLGLAMTGYAVAALWMNVFLATRPAPFAGLLLITAAIQSALYAWQGNTLAQIMGLFAASGWFLAIAGLILYVAWLRPTIAGAHEPGEPAQ